MVDETGLARIFSLVTEQFRFVLHHFCECNTDWICIALLFASWITSLLRSIAYQMVQRSSHWNQGATNHHAFFAITLPHLAMWPQFLLNCQRSYISVPIWWFHVWGRQRTLMQYSWTTPHKFAHPFRFISQAKPVNTTFAQEGFVRTLLRSLRSTTPSLIATQKFGRDTPFRLPFVGRPHRARTITHVPLHSYRQTRQIISPNISRPLSVTSSRKRASQLVVNSQTSVWPPSRPSTHYHPTSRYLSSKPGTGSLASSV